MSGVSKLSVSLPTPLAEALKAEARERGVPLSQLLTDELTRRARASHLRIVIDEQYGPLTDDDRAAGRRLLAAAQTPDEILGTPGGPDTSHTTP
jgi:hypothetical protein